MHSSKWGFKATDVHTPFTLEIYGVEVREPFFLVGQHQDKLVAYMWCDLKEFRHSPCRYILKKNEAYLYDAQVAPEYRGKSLAPYLRNQFYSALKQYSKDTYFSVSDYANSPAIRFKKKLGARFLKLCLYVNLWDKFSRNWVLRDYIPK